MIITNHNHIAARIEAPDNSVREDARSRAVELLTEVITDQRMESPAWVSDAQGDFSQSEYDAITVALIAGDAMEAGRLTLNATRASIRRGAVEEAERRVDAMDREDERDYAEMMTEH